MFGIENTYNLKDAAIEIRPCAHNFEDNTE